MPPDVPQSAAELLQYAAAYLTGQASAAEELGRTHMHLRVAAAHQLAKWLRSAAEDAVMVGPDVRALLFATAVANPPNEDPSMGGEAM